MYQMHVVVNAPDERVLSQNVDKQLLHATRANTHNNNFICYYIFRGTQLSIR